MTLNIEISDELGTALDTQLQAVNMAPSLVAWLGTVFPPLLAGLCDQLQIELEAVTVLKDEIAEKQALLVTAKIPQVSVSIVESES